MLDKSKSNMFILLTKDKQKTLHLSFASKEQHEPPRCARLHKRMVLAGLVLDSARQTENVAAALVMSQNR